MGYKKGFLGGEEKNQLCKHFCNPVKNSSFLSCTVLIHQKKPMCSTIYPGISTLKISFSAARWEMAVVEEKVTTVKQHARGKGREREDWNACSLAQGISSSVYASKMKPALAG